MAVRSSDPQTDAVGAFVGMRGSRIKNIIRELNDEKIDVVNYSPVSTELLQNLLYPVEIQKIAIFLLEFWMGVKRLQQVGIIKLFISV